MIRISHELPRQLISRTFDLNDYEYFLIHQITNLHEYLDAFIESRKRNRMQILDNSAYELGKSFDADLFAGYVKELKPSEYLIPDAFNDYDKNMSMFDNWMVKYGNIPGTKIATLHAQTMEEYISAYKFFEKTGVKIAFNFAEKFMNEYGGRLFVIKKMIDSNIINTDIDHHILGCSNPFEFLFYKDYNFISTADTSHPVTSAVCFETGSYPIGSKPKIKVDDLHYTNINVEMICKNIAKFKELLK